MGALTQLVQVWNIATLNQFWPCHAVAFGEGGPFFLTIVMHLMAGMLQFTRMVLLLPQKE